MGHVATAVWIGDVHNLLEQCEQSGPPANLLRQTHDLFSSGPAKYKELARAIARPELDDLLHCGAFESASLRLIGRCGYMLSGAPDSVSIVTVVLPFAEREMSFSSRSFAAAVVGALMTAILDDSRDS